MKYPIHRRTVPQCVAGASRYLHRIYGRIPAINTHSMLGFRIVLSLHVDPREDVDKAPHGNTNR
jgi:hypothetical protein